MENDVLCENCKEEHASVNYQGDYICIACKREIDNDEMELSFIKKRNEEISNWVKEQGDISLDAIMQKAYEEFIKFDDFGRVLHFYMELNRR